MTKVPFKYAFECRSFLPYGRWTRRDGSQVLFNRSYVVFAIKDADDVVRGCRSFWVHDIVKTEHYWQNGKDSPLRDPDTFERCCELLENWGLVIADLYLAANPITPGESIRIAHRHHDRCSLFNDKKWCDCDPGIAIVDAPQVTQSLKIIRISEVTQDNIPPRPNFEDVRVR